MRTYGPFAEISPRGFTGWIDEDRRDFEAHVRMMLGHLDGESRFRYLVWKPVDNTRIFVSHKDVADEFIQAAGSQRGITIEVRFVDDAGIGRLCVVGLPVSGSRTVHEIAINESRAVEVLENEVFTLDEATEIFCEYRRSGHQFTGYALRELDLTVDQSVERAQ